MISFDVDTLMLRSPSPRIKVLGIGGAGGNTINSMIAAGIEGIECIAINTDAQALHQCQAPLKIQLGPKTTKGLGTGANAELGKLAAEEDIERIVSCVEDADIVFLLGGLGGGTGSGALPVVGRVLKEHNILSIAVVTKPFVFEGSRRAKTADDALARVEACVDTLIVIPNQKLIEHIAERMSLVQAFARINTVIADFVKGVAETIIKPGHINVDFADVRAIMTNMGRAVMGIGRSSGEQRAERAAEIALASPLLENVSIEGARSILLNIAGNNTLGLDEVSFIASLVHQQAHPEANIILGSVIDESLGDELCVTLIATGFTARESATFKPADATTPPYSSPSVATPQPVATAPVKSADELEIPAVLRRMVQERPTE